MQSKRASKFIAMLATASILLSACAAAAPAAPAASDAPAAGAGATTVTPKGQFPVVEEPTTLSVLIRATNGTSDFEVNEFTQWLEEQTGIDLTFDVAPNNTEEAQQKLNLVLASGQLPDVIINMPITLADQQTLADQGLIIPLDDLIAEYGDEFATVLSDMPQVKDANSLADGKMYSLPEINDCYHCSFAQKAWIYKPWLDALGLEVPTTTDELYTVLKAFKEQDPNGNGIADEVPWSASVAGGWQSQIDRFIMNAFVLNPTLSAGTEHMYVEDGQVKAAFAQEGWKEGLKYLNKLYSEGLIDPESFTNDSTQLKGLGESADVPVLGFVQEGWPGMFLDWGGASGRSEEYVPIAPLKGPTGLQQTPENAYQAIGTGKYVITSAAENPAAAFRLADLMYSFEGTLRNAIGRPDQEWALSEEGAEGIDGSPAKYKVLVVYNEGEQAISWNQGAPNYRSAAFRLGQEYSPADPLERLLYNWSKDLYAPYGKPDMFMPPLVFTSEQSQRLGELNTAITTQVDQSYAAFVTGQADIESGWDSYLTELENLGLQDYLDIYQAAYDAKYAN